MIDQNRIIRPKSCPSTVSDCYKENSVLWVDYRTYDLFFMLHTSILPQFHDIPDSQGLDFPFSTPYRVYSVERGM